MKTSNYLLPYRFKLIGAAVLLLTLIFAVISSKVDFDLVSARIWSFAGFTKGTFELHYVSLDNTIVIVCGIVSLLFIVLSKEKIEDECVAAIRARSFALSLWISSGLLVIASVFVYDIEYLSVLIINLFLNLVLTAAIQRVMIYRFKKINDNE